jgi:Flp pilus assembly secretin CpaC
MKSDFAVRRRQLQQETHGDFGTHHGLTWLSSVEIRLKTRERVRRTMTSTLRIFILGVLLLLTTNSVTQAADRTITLMLGAGSALEVERPFKTIMIGDPDIVDVHAHSDRSVILEPLNPGATNLVFVDERSIAISNVRILVCSAGAIPVKYEDAPDCE